MAFGRAEVWGVLLTLFQIAPPSGPGVQVQSDGGAEWAEVEVSAWEETLVEAGEAVGGDPLAACEVAAFLDVAEMRTASAYGFLRVRIDELLSAADADARFGFLYCSGDDGEVTWFVWVAEDGLPPGLGEVVARSARAEVRVPTIDNESSPEGWDIPHLTQLPVWLWIDDDGWSTVTGSASLPGFGVSATVTATPVSSTWLVDGDLVAECEQGNAWQPGSDDDAAECSVTFDQPFEGSLSTIVTYDVTVSCVPAGLCDGVAFDPIRAEVTRPIRAVEAWGVVTADN